MAAPDLQDVMKLYAREGVRQWNDPQTTSGELKKRARECLGGEIADNEAEASDTLSTEYNGKNANLLRFIPMPRRPKSGIERCFFLPIRERHENGNCKFSFDLFILVGAKNCLAFRFEQAHPAPTTHRYGHVQLSRSLLRRTILTKTLPWIPVRYPAFPISTSDPLRTFLSMATTVHGYEGGVDTVLREIYQNDNRPGRAKMYLDQLQQMLI
jgi:hypothetical protein